MKDFEIKIIQYCKPIFVTAKDEEEVRAILEKRVNKEKNEYDAIEGVEIRIRDKNQHWFRTFIDNNF